MILIAEFLPPPESLMMSSSRCGIGLSSSNWIHFPVVIQLLATGNKLENTSLDYGIFETNHFLA